jgi:hypothetical protein
VPAIVAAVAISPTRPRRCSFCYSLRAPRKTSL